MTTKLRRRRKVRGPRPVVGGPEGPGMTEGVLEAGFKEFAKKLEGSMPAEFHRKLGEAVLQLSVVIAPRFIAAIRAARRGWRKPDAEARRRAKVLAKTWGV